MCGRTRFDKRGPRNRDWHPAENRLLVSLPTKNSRRDITYFRAARQSRCLFKQIFCNLDFASLQCDQRLAHPSCGMLRRDDLSFAQSLVRNLEIAQLDTEKGEVRPYNRILWRESLSVSIAN